VPRPFNVEVVTPEGVLFSDDAEMLSLRTPEGEIAFLAGHSPMVGEVIGGDVRIQVSAGDERVISVAAGFVNVARNNAVVIADELHTSEALGGLS
jgi:F-type H+-transporting ATPase subunit epsilon